ncbi:MAG TPA: DNA polymerase III subunit beta [Streptosporangiaceae bacterium]|nr:DNA polymerase III subunit beta [Streptosporangiaceae bacterium]
MKFRAEPDALAEAVAWVARELPSRPVVPVLSGLRLQAGAGELALSCFDYDLAATAHLAAEVSEPGTALVPGRLLAEITRSLPSQPVEVITDGDEVSLACGSAEFTLVSLPLAEYPAPPPPPPPSAAIDGAELAVAIGQVLPAASRDDTLPVLTAVSLDVHGDLLTLAATDRYRLAVRHLRWQPHDPQLRTIALVPAKTLADAARMMAPGVPVTVALPAAPDSPAGGGQAGGRADPHPAEGMASFESGGRRLAGRLLAGEFLRYESRFPAEFSSQAELTAASFTEAVRRVSLVADRASPVRLTFGDGRVVVEAQTEGRARAVETVTASFHGDAPSIAFNPHFLLDGLTAASAGPGAPAEDGTAATTIRLQFTSPAKPALITLAEGADDGAHDAGQPSFRYLVVPLRPPGGTG